MNCPLVCCNSYQKYFPVQSESQTCMAAATTWSGILLLIDLICTDVGSIWFMQVASINVVQLRSPMHIFNGLFRARAPPPPPPPPHTHTYSLMCALGSVVTFHAPKVRLVQQPVSIDTNHPGAKYSCKREEAWSHQLEGAKRSCNRETWSHQRVNSVAAPPHTYRFPTKIFSLNQCKGSCKLGSPNHCRGRSRGCPGGPEPPPLLFEKILFICNTNCSQVSGLTPPPPPPPFFF